MNYSDIGDFTYVSLACAFGKSTEAQKRETTDQDNFIVIIGGDSEDKMIPEILHQPDMRKVQNLLWSHFFGI